MMHRQDDGLKICFVCDKYQQQCEHTEQLNLPHLHYHGSRSEVTVSQRNAIMRLAR